MIYVIAAVIVAAFIGILMIWRKKTLEKEAAYMKQLTPEQVDYLKNVGLQPYKRDKEKLTKAILMNVKEGNGKNLKVDIIFYNPSTARLELGETKMRENRIHEDGVKVGDYVDMILVFSKEGYVDSTKGIL